MNNNFSLYCPGNRNNVRYIDGYRQSHSCRRSGPRLPPRRSNDHRCSHSRRVAANRNSRGVKTADVSLAEGIEAIVSAVTHIVGGNLGKPVALIGRSGDRSTRGRNAPNPRISAGP